MIEILCKYPELKDSDIQCFKIGEKLKLYYGNNG